jgi:2'-5' RNA ligase
MARPQDTDLKLYFIAFVPPEPAFSDAMNLKLYFKEKYKSKAALNSPPHITLHMPFQWSETRETDLVQKLHTFFKAFDPIKLCLDNFGSFAPRVIFLNITASVELINFQKSLQRFSKRELNLFNANYKEEPYNPHLTLAFRDLKKSIYTSAWEEFRSKEYKAEFVADAVTLLKHDSKTWQAYKHFTLESSFSTDVTRDLETTEG